MSIFSSNKDNRETPQNTNYTPPAPTPVQNNPSTSASSYGGSTSHSSSPLTTISEGTTLEGQIKIEGDIKIEGIVKGTVTSKGKVIISGTGRVDGDIICQSADISGSVGGKLKIADILYLKGNANIDGDINTGKLVIENGVKFNGNCSMGNPLSGIATPPKTEATKVATSMPLDEK